MAKLFSQRPLVLLALLSAFFISTTPAQAATFTEICYAQQQLQILGYQPGDADGLMGPRTRAAIKQYQQNSQLPTTGTLGPRTKAQLRENLPDFPPLATQRRRPGESKRVRSTAPPGIVSRAAEAKTSQQQTSKTAADPRRIPGSDGQR